MNAWSVGVLLLSELNWHETHQFLFDFFIFLVQKKSMRGGSFLFELAQIL